MEYIEYYFVQLLFSKNRELLYKENRELYDVLFSKYEDIYYRGKKYNVDLSAINSGVSVILCKW